MGGAIKPKYLHGVFKRRSNLSAASNVGGGDDGFAEEVPAQLGVGGLERIHLPPTGRTVPVAQVPRAQHLYVVVCVRESGT